MCGGEAADGGLMPLVSGSPAAGQLLPANTGRVAAGTPDDSAGGGGGSGGSGSRSGGSPDIAPGTHSEVLQPPRARSARSVTWRSQADMVVVHEFRRQGSGAEAAAAAAGSGRGAAGAAGRQRVAPKRQASAISSSELLQQASRCQRDEDQLTLRGGSAAGLPTGGQARRRRSFEDRSSSDAAHMLPQWAPPLLAPPHGWQHAAAHMYGSTQSAADGSYGGVAGLADSSGAWPAGSTATLGAAVGLAPSAAPPHSLPKRRMSEAALGCRSGPQTIDARVAHVDSPDCQCTQCLCARTDELCRMLMAQRQQQGLAPAQAAVAAVAVAPPPAVLSPELLSKRPMQSVSPPQLPPTQPQQQVQAQTHMQPPLALQPAPQLQQHAQGAPLVSPFMSPPIAAQRLDGSFASGGSSSSQGGTPGGLLGVDGMPGADVVPGADAEATSQPHPSGPSGVTAPHSRGTSPPFSGREQLSTAGVAVAADAVVASGGGFDARASSLGLTSSGVLQESLGLLALDTNPAGVPPSTAPPVPGTQPLQHGDEQAALAAAQALHAQQHRQQVEQAACFSDAQALDSQHGHMARPASSLAHEMPLQLQQQFDVFGQTGQQAAWQQQQQQQQHLLQPHRQPQQHPQPQQHVHPQLQLQHLQQQQQQEQQQLLLPSSSTPAELQLHAPGMVPLTDPVTGNNVAAEPDRLLEMLLQRSSQMRLTSQQQEKLQRVVYLRQKLAATRAAATAAAAAAGQLGPAQQQHAAAYAAAATAASWDGRLFAGGLGAPACGGGDGLDSAVDQQLESMLMMAHVQATHNLQQKPAHGNTPGEPWQQQWCAVSGASTAQLDARSGNSAPLPPGGQQQPAATHLMQWRQQQQQGRPVIARPHSWFDLVDEVLDFGPPGDASQQQQQQQQPVSAPPPPPHDDVYAASGAALGQPAAAAAVGSVPDMAQLQDLPASMMDFDIDALDDFALGI